MGGDNGKPAVAGPGLRERLALALFPQRWPSAISQLGDPNFPGGELHLDTFVMLGWQDRLRALVSGKLVLRMRVKVDQPIGAFQARTTFSVLPAWTWTR